MNTCVIYLRISREKGEGEKELSIESQLGQCQHKADSLGATVLRVFTDRDKTGRNDRRLGFQSALAFCEMHGVDYFITWSTSRFARNIREAKNNKARLSQAGTRIAYVTTDIAESDDGFLQETMFELFDDYYSRVIAKDTRRSMAKNAQDGYFNGGRPPYGYIPAPHPENNNRRTLIIDDQEEPIVRRIFRMRLQGIGAKSIADTLNAEQITLRGNAWSKKSVTSILRNTKMIGQTIFGRANVNKEKQPRENWIITQSHQPIIDEKTWHEVQAKMNRHQIDTDAGSPKSTWLFTGILRCGGCGNIMKICSGKGRTRRYYYYNCPQHLEGTGCSKHTVRSDMFDTWMIEQLGLLIFTPENLSAIAHEVNTNAEQWARERKTNRAELNKERRALEKKNDVLYNHLENPGNPASLTLAEISPRLKANTARINEIRRAIDRIDYQPLPNYPKISPTEMAEFMMHQLSASGTTSSNRKFLSMLLDELTLNNKSVTIRYRPELLLDAESIRFPVGGRWLPDRQLLGTIAFSIIIPETMRLNAA